MIGVTKWLAEDVLRGVKFRRPLARGHAQAQRGSAANGVSLGRQVDQLFKTWCKTGKLGKRHPGATVRAAHAVAAMKRLNLRPVVANLFVNKNGIKTHMDAVAKDSTNRTVVIELKSTQSSAAAHEVNKNAPCLNQPSTRFGPNTEHLHHRLQTAFGVHAHNAAYGVVIVACGDKAVATTVHKNEFAANKFTRTRGPPTPLVIFQWPQAAAEALPGGASVSACGQHATLHAGGSAIALKQAPSRQNKATVDAAKRHLSTLPQPWYLVFPGVSKWRRRCVK
jgi:hypothetical protein